jgi:hypothetical protein
MKILIVALLSLLVFQPTSFADPVSCAAVHYDISRSYAPSVSADDKPSSGFSIFSYYWSKIKSLRYIDKTATDAVMLRTLIMTTSTKPEFVRVPLSQLLLIHDITHPDAMDKLQERVNSLKKIKEVALSHGVLTDVELNKVLPSKNSIRGILSDDNEVVVFDGNGRLRALQLVFGVAAESSELQIEIELYKSDSTKLQQLLKRLRSSRGLSD